MSDGQLTLFEGQSVRSATVTLAGATAAFREALAMQPRQIQIGEEARMVLELVCVGIHYEQTKDDDGPLRRVHVMKVLDARYGNLPA